MKQAIMKKTYVNILLVIAVLAIVLGATITIVQKTIKHEQIAQEIKSPELLRSLMYEQVDEEAEMDSDYVKFVAFFTRDLDNDGYAEKLKGTCKNITKSDELYIDFNVLTNGYFKNGKITLNAPNFTWNTSIVEDNIVKGKYIGQTTTINLQDNIPAGSQKMLWGTVKSDIGDNINNYTGEATITLTGIHVSDDGVETPITKTTNVIVDWYGEVEAKINSGTVNKDIEDIKIDEDTVRFEVEVSTNEKKKQLLLKENNLTAEIPLFNGYAPTSVTTNEKNYTYDSETRMLTIKRNAIVNENGQITTPLSRTNGYKINIDYPIEAYDALEGSITLEIPLSTNYVAYNNNNEGFENPITSNIAKSIVAFKYDRVQGYIYKFDITVGKQSRSGYTVSKEKPLKIYNGLVDNTEEDFYNVAWNISRGTVGNITSMTMKEQPEKYSDEFLNSSNEFSSMLEYSTNVGIYFVGATASLGEDGYIKLYNDETNELVHTFTIDDWNEYNSGNFYKYETPIKHVRIETNGVAQRSNFTAYNIKEIDDELLVSNISKTDFDEIKYVYSYLEGSVTIEGNSEKESINDTGIAQYLDCESIATILSSTYEIGSGKTVEDYRLFIMTSNSMFNDSDWKNGTFIIKLPSEIVALKVKDVTVNKSYVEILGYEIFEKDGSYFIKIMTQNNTETTYTITVNCDITANPATKTCCRDVELYAHNEIGGSYINPVKDIYDVDSNENFDENVQYSSTFLDFICPSTIITSQYITDYNSDSSVKIAPNIVNIPDDHTTAKINLLVYNNYNRNIDEVRILGVIPTEGNSYIVNGSSLNSMFSVTMNENGINVPNELKNIVKVYYSEKINPTKDLTDSENGWKLNPSDWSKVKTYLIDFGDYIIQAGKSYEFSYGIEIAKNVPYNTISYSEHAIYFGIDTEGGKLLTQTEPSKLGIKVIRNFGCEFAKNKKGFENKMVPDATYRLTYTDYDGTIVNRILKTNKQGTFPIDNLFVGIEYSLSEIKAPSYYTINDEVYTFSINKNDNGVLYLTTSNTTNVLWDAVNEKVLIKAEDEPKYNITLIKKDDKSNEVIPGVIFAFNGKNYYTNVEGKINIDQLDQNVEYCLKESPLNGYYKIDDIKFKVAKNEDTDEYELVSDSSAINNYNIINTAEDDLMQVEINIDNEKIPTYKLQILKVAQYEDGEMEEIPLANAEFKLTGNDLNNEEFLTTDENGIAEIDNLYQFVEGKEITGKYLLQEMQAPDGYANSAEDISFVVTKNNNTLQAVVENRDNLESLKDIQVTDNTIKFIIQDKPLFRLKKIDATTKEPLANAKFTIKELNENQEEVDFAKDSAGNYFGEFDKKYGKYIISTDENGIITLLLGNGNYKVIEVESPEGYRNDGFERVFSISDEEIIVEGYADIDVYCFEDLLEISQNITNGNTYENQTIKLTRDLDVNDNESYRDIYDTSFGDINRDKKIEGIKAELMGVESNSISVRSGLIGDTMYDGNYFQGTFDGYGHEIKNLNMSLFINVQNGTIKNVGVSGGNSNNSGIVQEALSSQIINCYNKSEINSLYFGGYIGGIVGTARISTIAYCYNEGNITGAHVGGIAGEVYGTKIKSCYNTGNIEAYRRDTDAAGGCAGGILYYGDYHVTISDCYNTGNIICSLPYTAIGGIAARLSASYNSIDHCYNAGYIDEAFNNGPIVGTNMGIPSENVKNCYFLEGTAVVEHNYDSQSESYMRSSNFCNALNSNGAWEYIDGLYPQLKPYPKEIIKKSSITLNVENKMEKYTITTEIGKNSQNERNGGTVTGTFNSDYLEDDNVMYVETVEHNNSSTNKIEIKPSEQYEIVKISINGKEIDFTPDADGNVIFNEGYFENIDENKHIVVVFEKITTPKIKITKVDEDNNEIKISGVKLKVFRAGETYDYENAEPSATLFHNEAENVNIVSGTNVSLEEYSNGKGVDYANDINFTLSLEKSAYCRLETAGRWFYGRTFKVEVDGIQIGTYTNISDKTQYDVVHVNLGVLSSGNHVVRLSTTSGYYAPMYDYFTVYKIGDYINEFVTYVTTDANGEAVVNVPEVGNYGVQEVDAPDNYVIDTQIHNVEVESNGTKNVIIKNKIRTYKITTKVDRNYSLPGDCGTISGKDEQPYEFVAVNEDSVKDILVTPDEGYQIEYIKVNGKTIEFTPDEDGNVLLDKFVNMTEDKEVVVRFKQAETESENKFKITKVDKTSNEPLSGVQFVIYNLTTGGDFAKNNNRNYIGRKNENGLYVVTTNENGEILADLPAGSYKAVEIKGTDGYVLPEKEEDRTTYFTISVGEVVEINTIEDLVEFSNNVSNGNTYSDQIVKLMRDLDFNDLNSYRTYENKSLEDIKTDLGIAENGFMTIGMNETKNVDFCGIFDGNNHTINNFYSHSKYGSLFASVKYGTICNLKLTNVDLYYTGYGAAIAINANNSAIFNCSVSGNISGTAPSAGIVSQAENCDIINCSNNASIDGVCPGGIAYSINNSVIDHCYNNGEIVATSSPAGGLVYSISNSTISNCYNTGDVSGNTGAGGISFTTSYDRFINVYNTGDVTSASSSCGGIGSTLTNSEITNVYNSGNITGSSTTGGIAYVIASSNITNCYNEGTVISQAAPAGGIAQTLTNCRVDTLYNTGKVSGKYGAGGIAQAISSDKMINVYNTGEVVSPSSPSGGIGYSISSTEITNCYNEGNVISENSYAGGIAYTISSSKITNCYNEGNSSGLSGIGGIAYEITGNSVLTKCANRADAETDLPYGGIAHNSSDSKFIQCCNTGNMNTTSATGGLFFSVNNCELIRCYNSGNITSKSVVGGLIYTLENSKLNCCYNSGDISSTTPVSGLAYNGKNSNIENCFNSGNIKESVQGYAFVNFDQGGMFINNCYNLGNINAMYGAYMSSTSSASSVNNCCNFGTINSNNGSGICSYYPNNTNIYYLMGSADRGMMNGTQDMAISKTGFQMRTASFAEELNSNKDNVKAYYPPVDWKYNPNSYPTLDFEIDEISVNINSEMPEIQPLTQKYISENRFEKVTDELTINNSKQAIVYVHHLLEGSTPEDPIKLAEDETIIGKENYDYSTSPRLDIEGYNLIKDVNGEYVIPENASGKFTLEDQNVYYYYNLKPLELIVHHYLDGTEEKLADDEYYYYNENEHYKTAPSEEILKSHDLVFVVGDEEKDITQNEEVTYYYKEKEYQITTKVVIPQEEAINGRTEKGGTISGEGETPYEVVKSGKDSVKEIEATHDDGYEIIDITVNGIVVPYEENGRAVVIKKFKNMTENKEVIVQYTPIVGKVITHHYLEGTTQKLHDDVINTDKIGTTITTTPVEIKDYKLVGSEGNKDENGNVVITKEISEGVEEITYYYQASYNITTDVIEHTEKYKDGSICNNIKGGSITNEDVVIHELVVKGNDNEKTIEMIPDEGYEIAKITINGNDISNLEPDENGKVVIPAGYFKDVQHNIHIEVEYRAKSKVIVKYLENETENELAANTEILGYEGKDFETSEKTIPGYTLIKEPISEGSSDLKEKITDENKVAIEPNGTMFSDDITIIYWYQKIDASVIERHIEINAKGEEKLLETIPHSDTAGTNVEINRKEYSGYISADASDEVKQFVEDNYSNVTLVDKSNNTLTIVASDNEVKEAWFYYTKTYNITTEVKKHKETKDGEDVYVEGGTISKNYEEIDDVKVEITYEVVQNRADNEKEIKMIPDEGYIIKSVTINDNELLTENLKDDEGNVIIPVGYFKDVQKDYHIVVEYEPIPAKVIVKYIDKDTRESIIADKVIDGYVANEYDEPRVDLEGYMAVDPEPDNSKGNMQEEAITIIYYYQKQYKITTDVIEHYEEKDKMIVDVSKDTGSEEKEKILVKGGSIQGEDETPYEIVPRGKDNTKEIKIKPDDGYRIKSLAIEVGDVKENLSVIDMLQEDNTIVLPKAYFKDMQEDKHILVEFERIPSKLIVKYLDEKTNEPVSSTEGADGYVGDKYITHVKEISNYEIIKDKLPVNAEGTLSAEDTIVIYYYKKIEENVDPTIPDEPEKKDEPVLPDWPDTPDEPNTLDEPDIPGEPDKQENTEQPTSPQTGDNILIVVIIGLTSIVVFAITKEKHN